MIQSRNKIAKNTGEMNYAIVYFAFVGQNLGGVEKKILQQYDSITSLGKEIHLYMISSFLPSSAMMEETKRRENVHYISNSNNALRNPIERRREKLLFAESILKSYPPEKVICYFRYPIADPIFLRFLKTISDYKIVTEHQEIEVTFNKIKLNGNYLRNISELIWGKAVRNRINGFVGVTPDIVKNELFIDGDTAKPSISIGNGINVLMAPIRKKAERNLHIIKILFVGSGYRSHGLYRLFESIHSYNNNAKNNDYQILVKIAGESKEMAENKRIVAKLDLSKNVQFLGDIPHDELDELFEWADIGIDSLGLHRIGFTTYSSTLKLKEYVSRGLPFICAHKDGDLPDNFEYAYYVRHDDSVFDMRQIIAFVLEIRKDKNHPQKMREIAEEYLDWNVKATHLVKFLDQVVNL